jgi:phosphoenolpyruvate-protein kinase (PTS system EI component)
MYRHIPVLLLALCAGATHAAETDKAVPAARPSVGTAPSEQQFEAAYQHMKKMLAQMEQIKMTKDPQERQRLMLAHRQAMRDGAMAMRFSGGSMMRGMNCHAHAAGDCPMPMQRHGTGSSHEHMGMMERRMDMMQMMMEQMIEHENQKAPSSHQE